MHYGIIAAGEGSRLRQEGIERPKPLVLLNGVPMIERLIRQMIAAEAESVSVIVNEQMSEVADFLRSLAPSLPVPLQLVVKSTPSSMHSFYELSSLMKGKGRFILTTVDTIFHSQPFARYAKAFAEGPEEVDCMMGITGFVDDEKPLYVATLPPDVNPGEENRLYQIIGFFDDPTPGVRFISGGIYGLDGSAISILEECMEKGVSRMRNFQRALTAGGLNVKGYDLGKIVDVDHAEDIRTAEQFV